MNAAPARPSRCRRWPSTRRRWWAQGPKQRERDAQILLADGKVTVTAGNKDILHSVPYSGVMSVSYSRGRDPLWNSPQGPAPVARMGGGAFGFIRGERHWIALRTRDAFVVLRLPDAQVSQLLGALRRAHGARPRTRRWTQGRQVGRSDLPASLKFHFSSLKAHPHTSLRARGSCGVRPASPPPRHAGPTSLRQRLRRSAGASAKAEGLHGI